MKWLIVLHMRLMVWFVLHNVWDVLHMVWFLLLVVGLRLVVYGLGLMIDWLGLMVNRLVMGLMLYMDVVWLGLVVWLVVRLRGRHILNLLPRIGDLGNISLVPVNVVGHRLGAAIRQEDVVFSRSVVPVPLFTLAKVCAVVIIVNLVAILIVGWVVFMVLGFLVIFVISSG